MADTFTAHYNFTKPQVGGDPDTWGDLLNANFDSIDTAIYDAKTVADAAVPKAGGTMTGVLAIAMANPTFTLDSAASSQNRYIIGKTNSSMRWSVAVGNSTAEAGSNTGSDFALYRYSDAGAFLAEALRVVRSNGQIVHGATTVLNGQTTINTDGVQLYLNKSASGQNNYILGATNSNQRWSLALGDSSAESGSNAGSDFALNRYADNNAYIGTPFKIARSDGTATFTAPTVAVTGSSEVSFRVRPSGANEVALVSNNTPNKGLYDVTGSTWLLRFNGTNQSFFPAVVSAPDFTYTSDRRLKSPREGFAEIQPLRRGIEELKRMLPREYVKGGVEEVGFFADEVEDVLPEAVAEGDDGYKRVSAPQVLALIANAVLDLDYRLSLLERC